MDRRAFLKLLGVGAAAAVVAPQLLAPEPHRRIWQVSRNAPVGSWRRIPGSDWEYRVGGADITFDVEGARQWAQDLSASPQTRMYAKELLAAHEHRLYSSAPFLDRRPSHSVLITGITSSEPTYWTTDGDKTLAQIADHLRQPKFEAIGAYESTMELLRETYPEFAKG